MGERGWVRVNQTDRQTHIQSVVHPVKRIGFSRSAKVRYAESERERERERHAAALVAIPAATVKQPAAPTTRVHRHEG